ncbi:MAG: GTP-binding protein [Thiomicrospira sp.]|uniref:CobW family GTP-binding protein n=1 Tax=Thiomicrospira sp. TaxID=935 RepID=UPI001A04947D|nr:GTP-binding protein [Thiomicrospira sp.]MBE0493144.1 GTP-binding protein [Thiomicrospira sp.]
MNKPIPVTLVTGLLGSGKTSLIRHLLQHKPTHTRWALIINEFGDIGIDGASLQSQDVPLFEVNGGCICCSAQANLAKALNQVGQLKSLDRLIIEPTGLGHPAQILDLLQRHQNTQPFKLQNTFCVLDMASFSLERYQKSAVLRDQISLADYLVLNKTDLISAQQLESSETFLKNLRPTKAAIMATQQAKVDLSWLEQTPTRPGFSLLEAPIHQATPTQSLEADSQLPNVIRAHIQVGPVSSVGWIFTSKLLFMRPAVREWFDTPPPGLVRAKGLIRMGQQWQQLNWIDGQLSLEEQAWRADSRLELVFDQEIDPTLSFQALEKSLTNLIQVRDL